MFSSAEATGEIYLQSPAHCSAIMVLLLSTTVRQGCNFLPTILPQYLQRFILHSNKPVLQHVQTHETPFSKHVSEGYSWFDVIINAIMLLLLL
jgi:hypothetical protein